MRVIALILFVVVTSAATGCDDDEPERLDPTPIDPRTFHTGTCVAPPVGEEAAIFVEDMEAARELLDWTPLVAGADYEIDSTSYVGWGCDGVRDVTIDYVLPQSDARVTMLQGTKDQTIEVGPRGDPVRIGGYYVQFLDVPGYDGIAVFETGESHDGETLYASVLAKTRAEAVAFIETLH